MYRFIKSTALGIILCVLTPYSYAQTATYHEGKIKVVALKRAEMPFVTSSLGHRHYPRYYMVNRFSYINVDAKPEIIARSQGSAHNYAGAPQIMTIRPFLDYQGSRSY